MADSDGVAASPEALLAEAHWLRRLATSLIGQDAEDLVQETYLAALRSPPAGDRPLRPWLATVLRNFAHLRHRRQSRGARAAAELGRTLADSLPSPEVLLAQHEAQRQVASAVSALDEPFRSTILLCYAEGKTPAQIAEHLGIPAATVRSRLKRGRDDLRARLTADAARTGTTLPALLLPLGPNTATVSAPLEARPAAASSGVGTWLPLLAGAVPVLMVTTWLLWPSAGREPDRAPAAATARASTASSLVPDSPTPHDGVTPMSTAPSSTRTASRTNLRAAAAAVAALAAAAAAGSASAEGRLPRDEAIAACMSIREKIVPCAGEYARQAIDQHLALTGKQPSAEERKKMEEKVLQQTLADGRGPEAARRKHCDNMLNQIEKGGAKLTKDSGAAMDACFKADGCKAQMACVFSESAKLLPQTKPGAH